MNKCYGYSIIPDSFPQKDDKNYCGDDVRQQQREESHYLLIVIYATTVFEIEGCLAIKITDSIFQKKTIVTHFGEI